MLFHILDIIDTFVEAVSLKIIGIVESSDLLLFEAGIGINQPTAVTLHDIESALFVALRKIVRAAVVTADIFEILFLKFHHSLLAFNFFPSIIMTHSPLTSEG